MIPRSDTTLPLPVTSLLTSVNELATSVPLGELRVVLNNLATGFDGHGQACRHSSTAAQADPRGRRSHYQQTDTLIQDGQTVLATQNAEAGGFTRSPPARAVRGQLVSSNADLRRLFATAPGRDPAGGPAQR